MLKNYIIVAIRNFKRNAVFAGISILGLTLGLAINAIIVLYLVNELTYDRYHKDSKQIYRLYQEINFGGNATGMGPEVNALLGPYLVKNYPDIITQARISTENTIKFKVGDNSFNETIFYTDTSFFEIFTCKCKYGNLQSALKEPFSLVLTEKTANKFFGEIDPIGKTIAGSNGRSYTVSAIIKNIPENSHFKFDVLSSFSSLYYLDDYKNKVDGWGPNYSTFHTYFKTKQEFDIKKIETEFPNIIKTYLSENSFFKYKLSIQPLEAIYLHYDGGGSISRIILFGIIGILVLLIPCINYMNLNTAESIKRLKEVGVRKVVGASQKQLIVQFLFESILISLISLVIAMTLAEIIIPVFNSVLNKNLAFSYFDQWLLSLGFIVITLLAGILAGSYPAFYLSSFKSNDALKGKFLSGSTKAFFRNSFIVLQFAISIFLICCTGIILMQIRYANNSDLGFKKENIVTIQLPFQGNVNPNLFVEQLSKIPEIKNIAVASGTPFTFHVFGHFSFDESHTKQLSELYYADANYIDLLGFKIIKGRKFLKGGANENNNVIINETLAKKLNWENPMGRKFKDTEENTEYTIIGIVKDFHMGSFHTPIYPCFLAYTDEIKKLNTIVCEIKSPKVNETISKINEVNQSLYTESELTVQFLEQEVEKTYTEELRTGYMFMYFAVIAIFITLIGLYGLSLFIAREKTKEIGIRKVFGSSVSEVVRLLAIQFIKVVLIALVIAIPVAWYYSNQWLHAFTYQIDNKWIIFVVASISVIVISAITIMYQSFKTANSNPIDTLRYE